MEGRRESQKWRVEEKGRRSGRKKRGKKKRRKAINGYNCFVRITKEGVETGKMGDTGKIKKHAARMWLKKCNFASRFARNDPQKVTLFGASSVSLSVN